jgi:hypothetical protein
MIKKDERQGGKCHARTKMYSEAGEGWKMNSAVGNGVFSSWSHFSKHRQDPLDTNLCFTFLP